MSLKNISRRKFVATTAVATAGLAAMPFVSSCADDRFKDKIKLGYIGVGTQAMHLMKQIMKCRRTNSGIELLNNNRCQCMSVVMPMST